jgi:hypothetical protein
MGGSRARRDVPDQGLTLSSNGTTTLRSTAKLTTLVAGSALAVGAIVACVTAPGPVGPPHLAAARPDSATAGPAAAPGGPGHLRPMLASALGPAAHAARAVASPRRARYIARKMLRAFGWTRRQFTYLNLLWSRESGWSVFAHNPASGAYGIPQAVPGGKMAGAGPDWRTSARTQIRWGLGYIRAIYGSPRLAWGHEATAGWY